MRQKWLQKPPLGTPINWSHPSAKGLVIDLEFQEGGGDLANDLSGNGNHGTLKNMAFPATVASGWNPGKFGLALKFDGTDDYVDVDTLDGYPDGKGYLSLSVWVKFSVSQSNKNIMGWWWNDNNYLYTSSTKIAFKIDTVDDTSTAVTTSAINDGIWHHIVGTYDKDAGSNNVLIYVDGVVQADKKTTTGVIDCDGDMFNIGTIGNLDTGVYNFQGQIDQVRVYNRALLAEEILDSYLDPFGRFERTKWGLLVPTAPPIGLSIPVAMHNYRRLRA